MLEVGAGTSPTSRRSFGYETRTRPIGEPTSLMWQRLGTSQAGSTDCSISLRVAGMSGRPSGGTGLGRRSIGISARR